MAARISERSPQGLRPAGNPPLAGGVFAPLLRLQPVQALGHAQRSEGVSRRLAVATRRLARAVGFERSGVAGRFGPSAWRIDPSCLATEFPVTFPEILWRGAYDQEGEQATPICGRDPSRAK